MGRHTGPVERLSRREGVELELKGVRRLAGKSALERRGPVPPGEHGVSRRRRQPSVFAQQLRAKQVLKRMYGVRERQFRGYVREAQRSHDRTGDRLLEFLERRLDNVIYRLGFATTRAQARQFVSHGHVLVDGRRVTIPSYRVKPGQVVGLASSSPVRPAAAEAAELLARVAPWLETDPDGLTGRVLRDPARIRYLHPDRRAARRRALQPAMTVDFGAFEALTFDVYGTLIDWETGIASWLRPFASASDDELLESFARHEAELEAGPYRSYRDVLAGRAARRGRRLRLRAVGRAGGRPSRARSGAGRRSATRRRRSPR